MSVYAVAREHMERELAAAECCYDRRRAQVIAQRIVEITCQEDFDECRRLDQPQPLIVSDDAL